jgi:uncharacterized protein (TIGR00369 family)
LVAAEGLPVGHTPLQRHLGIRYLDDIDNPPADGTARVQVEMRDDLRGPAGSLEGGLVATLLDTAGAIAASRALEGMVATQSLSICFTAPVKVGPALAIGTPLRAGRRDAVVEVRVTDVGNGNRLCATALLTAVRIGERPGMGADGMAEPTSPG